MKQTYVYDNASGNLLSRDYRISGAPGGLTESFSYDNLNRLTGSQVTGAGLMSVTYSPDGNINTKTDAGSYTYDPSKQNAITAMTRYYSGSYEKTITGSTVTETHYVSSPTGLVAILVKQGSAVQTYYVETDHLGSVTGIINTDKTYASRSSYDAWGRRRNPADWSYNNIPTPVITDRGFTGHEHLDRFGLINMNGRMYDPVVGRFLGVDPIVQAPDYSQSFNGYSYCWNNPLKYTDPSGETVYVIPPENFSSFINSVFSTINRIEEVASWYGMEYRDEDYPSYFANTYGSPGGNGGYLFENEDAGHNYLWILSGYGKKFESSGWYTPRGLFVLPLNGYGYPGSTNSKNYYENTFKESHSEYYEYEWRNDKYFMLDPLGLGSLEIFGHIHVHPWNKEKDDPVNPPDEGFSRFWEMDYGIARDVLKGLPMVLMNWDGKVFGQFYDSNSQQISEIPEVNKLTVTGICNRINGDKVMPIILRFQY